jgi:hypothetical protein
MTPLLHWLAVMLVVGRPALQAEGVGGIVLSQVEVIGGFSTMAGAIVFMFKMVISLGDKRVADRDREVDRLIKQNDRLTDANFKLSDALSRSAAVNDRSLELVKRAKSVGGGDV